MTDYYCDLNIDGPGNFVDRTGAAAQSPATPYTGPAGLQAAIRGAGNATALAPGDELFVTGTSADLARMVLLDCNGDDATGWDVGDDVRSLMGGTGQWYGRIVANNAGAILGADDMLLVLLSGCDEDDIVLFDGIENTMKSESFTSLAAKSTPGIVFDGASGTGALPIAIVGVNAAWVEDGTRAVLDAGGKAEHNVSAAAAIVRIHHRNIHGKHADSDGWKGTSTSSYWTFDNCVAEGSGGYGFEGFRYAHYERCKAHDFSGTYGFHIYISSASHCVAYNGSRGIYVSASSASGCVAFQCTDIGFLVAAGAHLYNCVADDNAVGVYVSPNGESYLVGCRITNNATGVEGSDAFHDPCTFYGGNTANWTADLGVDLIDGESTRTISDAAADIGYIDADNVTLADRNYGLTNQAAARRQAVTL